MQQPPEWTVWATGLKDVATTVAILVGGIWALRKFRLRAMFRQAMESVTIRLQAKPVWVHDDLIMYVEVVVENAGFRDVFWRSYSIKVLPLLGAIPMDEITAGQLSLSENHVESRLALIDRGERATFVGAVEIPLNGKQAPTACRVRFELYCNNYIGRSLKDGKPRENYLGWLKDRIVIIPPKSEDFAANNRSVVN